MENYFHCFDQPSNTCCYCWEDNPDIYYNGQAWHKRCLQARKNLNTYYNRKMENKNPYPIDDRPLTQEEKLAYLEVVNAVKRRDPITLYQIADAIFVCYATARKIIYSLQAKGYIQYKPRCRTASKYSILKRID